ncbi:MAG: hypothetical protein H7Y17_16935 [Chlorobia bacterium]|nr:hypothetical protein [Fimbriimonadaceae bacterium]
MKRIAMETPANPTPPYSQDLEQLKLLETFHKVIAGMYALFGFCGFPHFIIGILAATNPKFMNTPKNQGMDVMFGAIFILAGLAVILGAWTLTVLSWLSSQRIAQRRGIKLIYATAGLNCLWMPFGTALGVFTFIVLTRPSVRSIFPN